MQVLSYLLNRALNRSRSTPASTASTSTPASSAGLCQDIDDEAAG